MKKHDIKKGLIVEKVFCIAAFSLVLVFFAITILSMTMTGEDILHHNSTLATGSLQELERVYHALPRVGEFFQRIIIQFYDYQTTLGLSVIWRFLDILLCFLLIYLTTMLCLGRKPKLKYTDALVFLIAFIMLAISRYNEIFMWRFSYIHNYVPILILLVATAYILFYYKEKSKQAVLPVIGCFIVGLLFGFSNEIAPIAFLALMSSYIVYKRFREKVRLRDLASRSTAKTALAIGVVVGLLFMLSSGAIFSRGSSAYGNVYDYVSIFDLLHNTFYTGLKLIQHFIHNIKPLLMPIFMMLIILATEIYFAKTKKAKRPFIAIHLTALGFVFLYLAASSQIKVLDDLYPRFMSPIFLACVVSIGSFIVHIVELLRPKKQYLILTLAVLLLIVGAMTADIARGFHESSNIHRDIFEMIKESDDQQVCLVKFAVERQYYSPLFEFSQLPPFEEWTGDFGNSTIYGKNIYYSTSVCPSQDTE